MLARRKLRRRIDDALAVASPLALADAMDAHICARPLEEVRGLVLRSTARMDANDRAQLALYLNTDDPDDLLGARFSAFLRQNPRAISSLDPDAVDAILSDVGEIPGVDRTPRRLPAAMSAALVIAVCIALLPLAAQYGRQRGLLEGLTEPILPPPIAPFVQRMTGTHAAAAAVPKRSVVHHSAPRIVRHSASAPRHLAQHRAPKIVHRVHRIAAAKPHRRHARLVAWKFDRRNNPYFNRTRWRHPFVADASDFGERARLSVRSYLGAVVAGDLPAALAHLGLPSTGNTSAISELPIVSRSTTVSIVGSKPQSDDREEVQADIVTGGREYYEVFDVAKDGPAMRIVDRYYIPVNRSAQVAARLQVQHPH